MYHAPCRRLPETFAESNHWGFFLQQAMAFSKFKENSPSDGNPFAVVIYWKDVLENKPEEAIGCSIAEFERKGNSSVWRLRECATHLEKVQIGTSMGMIAGIASSVFGTAALIIGSALAPLTFGGTVPIAVVGGVALFGGVSASVGSLLAKIGWTQSDTEEAKQAQAELVDTMNKLTDLLRVYMKALSEAHDALSTKTGEERLTDARRRGDDEVEPILKEITKHIMHLKITQRTYRSFKESLDTPLKKVNKDIWGSLSRQIGNIPAIITTMKDSSTLLENITKVLLDTHKALTAV